jgi:hypothetical protein
VITNTTNYAGLALPAVPEPTAPLPFRLKLAYIWKILTNRVHIVGNIDVSHVKSDLYMEGRLRVDLTQREADAYIVNAVVLPDDTR